jgi:hypothetical protein
MVHAPITRTFAYLIGLALFAAIGVRPARAQDIHPSVEPILQHIQISFVQPHNQGSIKAAPPKAAASTLGERKRFILLSSIAYGAAFLDMHETISQRANFEERDPLAKPFVRLPKPAYYAIGTTIATGVNGLSWKMAHSERWHRVWWVPQAISVFGNSFGYGYTVEQMAQTTAMQRRARR